MPGVIPSSEEICVLSFFEPPWSGRRRPEHGECKRCFRNTLCAGHRGPLAHPPSGAGLKGRRDLAWLLAVVTLVAAAVAYTPYEIAVPRPYQVVFTPTASPEPFSLRIQSALAPGPGRRLPSHLCSMRLALLAPQSAAG